MRALAQLVGLCLLITIELAAAALMLAPAGLMYEPPHIQRSAT